MLDGSAALMHLMHSLTATGQWIDERESNILDGAAHFYDTYETADGKYVAIGAIEPQFYERLLQLTGSDPKEFNPQGDKSRWPALKRRLKAVFRTRTQAEWVEKMEGTDACFAPVLSIEDAPRHPHNQARGTFIDVGGVTQAAPAPRFSRTPANTPTIPHPAGSDTEAILRVAGYSQGDIDRLRKAGALP
jgi:alpha-methylacyl-CoA racemase